MCNAIFGRDLAHRNSILKRLSAVVDLPQRVTVNINHGNACNPASPLISQMFGVALALPRGIGAIPGRAIGLEPKARADDRCQDNLKFSMGCWGSGISEI
jgi:hypothetical protein